MRHLATILLVGLLALPLAGKVRPRAEQKQSEDNMRKDVTFLASDECEGRGPNTDGIKKAATYISDQFRDIGLTQLKTGWFQPFGVAGAAGELVLSGPLGQIVQLAPRKQFSIIGNNEAGNVAGKLVFVGYGISTDTYDDYAGVDVKDKIVVMLRDTPRAGRNDLPLGIRRGAGIAVKLTVAHRKKAKAAFIVNDPDTATAGDTPPDWSYLSVGRAGERAPAVFVRRGIVDLMMPAGTTLRDVERRIDRELKPHSFPLTDWTAGLKITRGDKMTALKNVVGVLEGKGPLANQTVVVGAHYDHLGYGNPESSLYNSKRRAIHHGADDNASGVAGIIELARRFAAIPNRQGRRIVFVAFSGEELGLFGSIHYCKYPPFPLADTVAMLNLDMIGRPARDPKTRLDLLLTEGHGTAAPFKAMMEKAAKEQRFTLSMRAGGVGGPSDHASFCEKKVPCIFLWTGEHDDYHRPSDTVEKINFDGMRRIVDMSEELVTRLTTLPRADLSYIEVKGKAVATTKLGLSELLERDDGGLEVTKLTAGSPASKAGIYVGDVIVSIDRNLVKDHKSYVLAVAMLRKGAAVEVGVLRSGKRITLKVVLPE